MNNDSAIDLASHLAQKGDLDTAADILDKILKDDPNNGRALVSMTFVLLRHPRPTLAYQCAKRATQVLPSERNVWVNMGFAAQDLWRHKEAKRCYDRALELCTTDIEKTRVLSNLCSWAVDLGNFKEGKKYAKQALALTPGHQKSLSNLGFCELGLREWEPGWKHYRYALYEDVRKKLQYGDEPEWDGTPGKTVAIYGEQGIGDEVSFASVLPDAAKDCKKIVLDCHPKLEGLFKRSFPQVKVYGTRKEHELGWDEEDRDIEASLPIGQLGEYYRTKDSDFPGEPYLVPDPDRVLMWKALFATKKKPVIGIAWRGGLPRTGARFRTWALDDIKPLLGAVDAHWVSLQYRPAKQEIARAGVDIHEYPAATLTEDYDDTAALVAACDIVITVQTAVAHLAGALGVPCWVFVPTNTQWRYGNSTDSIPWYKSLRVIRQGRDGTWAKEIARIAVELEDRFATKLAVANS